MHSLYLISNKNLQMLPIPDDAENDKTASRNFWRMWASFARTGKPHPQWQPLSKGNTFMDINPELEVKTDLDANGNLKFWDGIATKRLVGPIDKSSLFGA